MAEVPMIRHIGCPAWFPGLLAIAALTAATVPTRAVAQPVTKPSVSPVAPPTLRAPVFDTTTPVFNPPPVKNAAETVVAEVDGQTITLGDVAAAIKDLPPSAQRMAFSDQFELARSQLIGKLAVVQEARRHNVESDPAVRRQIQAATNTVLAENYLRQASSKDITEQAVLARYQRDIANRPGPDELRVRLIVVPTLAMAQDIIKQLHAGADFATLAKQYSKDSTAAAGGDLGYVSLPLLNSDLAAAAAAMPSGQVSAAPISSGGLWILFKVEDRRSGPPIPYAAVRAQIEKQIIQENVAEIARKALASSVVRVFAIDGHEIQDLPDDVPAHRDE